jgi:hypothetical protein
MDQDKRRYRQLKRDLKRAGNRRRRRHLQRQLREQPDEAVRVDFDFGRDSITGLKSNDRDATRRRKTEEEDHQLHE